MGDRKGFLDTTPRRAALAALSLALLAPLVPAACSANGGKTQFGDGGNDSVAPGQGGAGGGGQGGTGMGGDDLGFDAGNLSIYYRARPVARQQNSHS